MPVKYLLPHEVCEELDRLKTQKEKVDFLQRYQSFALKTILQLNFNDNIKLDLPEGKPPFRADVCPPGVQISVTKNAIQPIGKLVEGSPVSKLKKETMFLKMLESINEKDAEMLWRAKDGILEDLYPKMTKKLVEKAFPGIL
tara:strand:+ start:524 stop:949 length:426 start_codon:yes stop_codon:yes gene_type:complete